MPSALSAGVVFRGFVGTQTLTSPGLSLIVSWGPGWAWVAVIIGGLLVVSASALSLNPPQLSLEGRVPRRKSSVRAK